ncbi:hypothetical protein [Archangium sp.]|jgi:hypothetical protein|uniref:hypothetical protein n=1 Tax=Archangium sp. TaxID=1872627 RepID=UPI00389A1AE7
MTGSESPAALFRCFEHLIVRVAPGHLDKVLDFFTKTLGLPSPWMTRNASFSSAGVALGNIPLELLQMGPPRPGAPPVKLFGLVLEPTLPIDELPQALRARGVRSGGASPMVEPAEDGAPRTLWKSVYFDDRGGSSLWLRLFLAMTRRRPRTPRKPRQVQGKWARRFFNRAFANKGMLFAVEYVPPFEGPLRSMERVLADAKGPLGPLGILGVDEIVMMSRDPLRVRRAWSEILAPLEPSEAGRFEPGRGPALRVIPGPDERIDELVLKVQSLDTARVFLAERKLLGSQATGRLSIDLAASFGLRIALIA